MRKATMKVGDVYPTRHGPVKVLKYNNSRDVLVEFIDTGYQCQSAAYRIMNKQARDPYFRSVCGVGYIGEGAFNVSIDSKPTLVYHCWAAMIQRCYANRNISDRTYKDCIVDERWHNFQNYATDTNKMPGYDLKGWHLDKDILVPGNRVYSRKTCCFVPSNINLAVVITKNKKPSGLPVGVFRNGRHKQYTVVMGNKYFPSESTVEEAKASFVREKNKYVRALAKKHKTELSPKVYKVLAKWDYLIYERA